MFLLELPESFVHKVVSYKLSKISPYLFQSHVAVTSSDGHRAIFTVLEINRSKILQNLNKSDCFCLHRWLHFLWRFSCKN